MPENQRDVGWPYEDDSNCSRTRLASVRHRPSCGRWLARSCLAFTPAKKVRPTAKDRFDSASRKARPVSLELKNNVQVRAK
jgi:hypothetical protein